MTAPKATTVPAPNQPATGPQPPSTAPTSPQAAPAGHPGPAGQVSQAVGQSLRTLSQPLRDSSGNWRVVVRLDPPDLGSVDATVSVGPGGLNIALVASTPTAGQALQAAAHQMSTALGGQVTVTHPGAPVTGGGAGNNGHGPGGGHPQWGPNQSAIDTSADLEAVREAPDHGGEILVRA